MSGDTEGIPRCVKYGYLEERQKGSLLAEYCSREKIEAWVSVASEYGEELLQEELMESGNAGNPDLNHNTKESGQCADKEICFAKKSLKTVQASPQ